MTLKLIRGHYIMSSGAVTEGSSKEADVRDTGKQLGPAGGTEHEIKLGRLKF